MTLQGTVRKTATKMVSAGQMVGTVVGGVAGFFGADFIGLGSLVNSLWDGAGLETMVPALAKVQPVVVALVAMGAYLGIGYAILKFDGSGALGIVVKFAGWFCIGAGVKEALTGLTSAVGAIKTAGA